MRLIAVVLSMLLLATAAAARDAPEALGSSERVRVDSLAPPFDARVCTLGCFDVRYDRRRAAVYWIDARGVPKFVASYVPHWRSQVDAPLDAQLREIHLIKPKAAAPSAAGDHCGADGWGFEFGQLIGAAELPGGGVVSHTYIGAGQVHIVTIHPDGDGDSSVEAAPLAAGAKADRACGVERQALYARKP